MNEVPIDHFLSSGIELQKL